MSVNPKIIKVSRSQIGGRDGMYWKEPFDTIYLADDLTPEHEAEVLAHEISHALGDTLGEEPQ
jgi:hypothetical protein